VKVCEKGDEIEGVACAWCGRERERTATRREKEEEEDKRGEMKVLRDVNDVKKGVECKQQHICIPRCGVGGRFLCGVIKTETFGFSPAKINQKKIEKKNVVQHASQQKAVGLLKSIHLPTLSPASPPPRLSPSPRAPPPPPCCIFTLPLPTAILKLLRNAFDVLSCALARYVRAEGVMEHAQDQARGLQARPRPDPP
jgi:hypothetical protein